MQGLRDRIPEGLKATHADLMHRARWVRAPQARVTRRFVKQHGHTVQHGPFSGMRYPRFAVGRGELVVAQLLGAYEQELHEAFEAAIARKPTQIVDVGASDGYYAVGLARRLPDATVHAFEMNSFPARVCTALADENGVSAQVVMHGEATVETLNALPDEGPAFVLSDCEGAEAFLMDPDAVPRLREADLIIELHEFAVADICPTIERRFGPTHDIELIDSRRRFTGDYPELAQTPGTSFADWELGITEYRPVQMRWAVLTRKA